MSATPWLDDTLAPNGLTVRQNFKDWFGSSVVANELGEPLVLYHSTNSEFDVFRMSRSGSFGAGYYFAPDSYTAENFVSYDDDDGGDNVIPVFLSLQRPYRFDADFNAGRALGIDSAAVPLVEYALGDRARVAIRRSAAKDGNFGTSLRDALIEKGHDGVIARYGDGSLEYVSFFGHQIKSALSNSGLYLRDTASLTDRDEALRLQRAQRALQAANLKPASTLALV